MIYLDNAATSYPKPPQVLRAMSGLMENLGANPGRSGHRLSMGAGRVVLSAREQLAELFHVEDPFRFVFTYNCTDALNLAIKGSLYPGDHVVTTAMEHNSVLRPLKGMERRGIIRVSVVPPGLDGVVSPRSIEESLRPNTRLVVMTHAANMNGALQPIESVGRLCKRRGILFLVDAAQTAGVVPIDLSRLPLDMMAMPGHKGLFGPQGTGVLYLRPALFLTTLREGGTGSASESWYQPTEMPERYEAGTLNTPGLAGLFSGIYFVRRHQQEIAQKERALCERLHTGISAAPSVRVLSPADPDQRVAIVSFNMGDITSGQVADALDKADIAVRAGLHCAPAAHRHFGTLEQGAVRASIGFFNTEEDIDRMIDEVHSLAHAWQQ